MIHAGLARLSAAMLGIVLLSACVNRPLPEPEINTTVAPNTDIRNYGSYFVQKHAKDKNNVNKAIRDQMSLLGLSQVTTGLAQDRPADVDVLVEYVDSWQWDIRMYLLQLEITFHDARSDGVLAHGTTRRAAINIRAPASVHANDILTSIVGQYPN